jgi:hypothetical protein
VKQPHSTSLSYRGAQGVCLRKDLAIIISSINVSFISQRSFNHLHQCSGSLVSIGNIVVDKRKQVFKTPCPPNERPFNGTFVEYLLKSPF